MKTLTSHTLWELAVPYLRPSSQPGRRHRHECLLHPLPFAEQRLSGVAIMIYFLTGLPVASVSSSSTSRS